MNIPKEFNLLCRQFHQDVGLVFKSLDEMADFAVQVLNASQREVSKTFIDDLLTQPDSTLQEVWWKTPADIFFRKDVALRDFLGLIRQKLN